MYEINIYVNKCTKNFIRFPIFTLRKGEKLVNDIFEQDLFRKRLWSHKNGKNPENHRTFAKFEIYSHVTLGKLTKKNEKSQAADICIHSLHTETRILGSNTVKVNQIVKIVLNFFLLLC